MAGRYFGVPFATTGDRITVPDATQPDGSVSFTQGFGFDYERPNTDPAYKPVPRDGTNGLFHDITEALGIAQRQGVSDWTTSAQPYQINALVRHSDKVWRSLVSNNNVTPVEGASWTEVGALASETVAGIVEIATAAEAQAFTAGKAIDGAKLAAAFGGANQGLTSNGYQKLPGGLIIQWGLASASTTSTTVVFPIAFPNSWLRIINGNPNTIAISSFSSPTNSGFTCDFSETSIGGSNWLAIGF